jgi:hypothetical protein
VQPTRSFKTAVKHHAGNRQILVDGNRYNVPKGMSDSHIPKVDPVGDALQTAAKNANDKWDSGLLSATEARSIARAHRRGRHWLGNLLLRQAKGRYIEAMLRNRFPGLQWNRKGVDVVDLSTGLKYDILSGTKSNIDLHARRMADELFRMITF